MTRSQMVEKAQSKLFEVIDILEVACKGDRNAEAYIIDHLKIIVSEDHGFCASDLNLSNLIERYNKGDEDEEFEFEDDE